MGSFIKSLYLSLILLLSMASLQAKEVKLEGQYFIYSQDKNYIYGSGNLSIKIKTFIITGQTLFLDTKTMKGKLLGTIIVKNKKKIILQGDELTFTLFPFKYRCKIFQEEIKNFGDPKMNHSVDFIDIKELKLSSIYYELKSINITESKRISGHYLIPYIMGIPSIPVKKLAINKGDLSKRTVFFLKKTNYSKTYGLSLHTGLNIYNKNIRSRYQLKFFERELFNISGDKRGLIIDGKNSLRIKDKKILDFDILANSDKKSFNFIIKQSLDFKNFNYSVSHSVSGQKGNKSFHLLKAGLRIKNLKFLLPKFDFSYDYKGSTAYKISSPLKLAKSLRMNFAWERNIVNNDLKRNDSIFSTNLNFSSSILSLSSSLNISRDLIQSTSKQSFSLNLNLPDLKFLDNNLTFTLSPFYTFSSLPSGNYQFRESSPGFTFTISSRGVRFPLGIEFTPVFNMFQIWDSVNNNKTNFNYNLSLKKTIKCITFFLDYGLISRFSTNSHWVEGYNMNNLSIRIEAGKTGLYSLSSRFGYNNNFKLENFTLTGEIFLPFKSRLSTSLIYLSLQKKIANFEIYLEKSFRGIFKIRGGYSLSLKRFFVDLVHSI
jgi:hypothetical protein